jgi:hypothetical protein
MRTRVLLILFLIAAFALIFSGAGCEGEQGPAGPAGSSGQSVISVVGVVNVGWSGEIATNLSTTVSITNAPSIPEVKVNNKTFPVDGEWLWYGGRVAYYGSLYSADGYDQANLEINYTKLNGRAGSATSTISLPQYVTADDDDIQLPPYNPAEASWSTSDGADAYYVDVYFYNTWVDNDSFYTHTWYVDFDTVLTDTSLTIPEEDLFPDAGDVSSINSFDGTFYIYPVSGPWMPGVRNNIKGDGIGVFIATPGYEYIDVDLSVPGKSEALLNNDKDEGDRPFDILKVAEKLANRRY